MPKLVNEGENQIANILFGSTSPWSTLYVGLYTNSTEPAEGATLSYITEVSGTGYSRKSLIRGDWEVTDDYAIYGQQEWTAESDWGNVYGYFIATSADNSGYLIFVEHFSDGPYNMTEGSKIRLYPKVTIA